MLKFDTRLKILFIRISTERAHSIYLVRHCFLNDWVFSDVSYKTNFILYMKWYITQPYQTCRLGFSFAKVWFQSSHSGLEFQNRTLYNFAKVLLNWDLQSKTLHVFCCQHRKLPRSQKAGNSIENLVATTLFNGHLPYLIANAYKLSMWDQNGKKDWTMSVPKKVLHNQSFFSTVSLGCLPWLVTKWQKGVWITLRDGETEALWSWVFFQAPHRLMEDLRTTPV